ncbi:glycosyltransferase family 2 protein [Agreia pratensis]|uniref:Glycosyltransferase, GT2 family n=1 Tax=Agreia pratensis TaxID=150121 RepID=A0A1X7IMA3_9MICO|nr:glycosyltransferase [Agreia pratensis]SMG16073.1 Glycosyltransferase, GT2 family [Agreia pratensis]
MSIQGVVAVVVHHRSYDTVGRTVASLIEQGLDTADIVVIDNSEQPERCPELRQTIHDGVEIEFVENRGYAAAINAAIRYFREREPLPSFLLVATHETRTEPGAVGRLVEALVADAGAAVAGPTLVSGAEGEQFVWSTGGFIDPITHVPKHHDHRASLEEVDVEGKPRARRWLDGAFLLYRWVDIERHPLDERFFVYMEETDLHLRLGAARRRALWVPGSIVWQSSGGVPPYYFARNIRLLLKKHGNLFQRTLAAPYMIARRLLATVVRSKSLAAVAPTLRGALERLPSDRIHDDRPARPVIIINPLAAALAHYQEETVAVFEAAGVPFSILSVPEPSHASTGRVAWLRGVNGLYSQAAKMVRRDPRSRVLVLWPATGYVDLLLLALHGLRGSVILHDPHPLVRAIGYGALVRRIASRLCARRITLIALSRGAAAEITRDAGRIRVETLPHPILPPTEHTPPSPSQTVRVLGQFKKDRDLGALAAIGEALHDEFDLQVVGRGWPPVPGWTVESRFASESEMDELLQSSAAVVVPYRRFYQSGIGIRCLEHGTPLVAPAQDFLVEILGTGAPGLVEGDARSSWVDGVRQAMDAGRDPVIAAAAEWHTKCLRAWTDWANRE